MTKVQNFLAQFQGWAHWFAGVAITAVTLYATNDAVRQAVDNLVAPHKKLAAALAGISSILLAYSKSQKPA